MDPTYRSWLQGLANNPAYGLPSQGANALLRVAGDDFGINQNFPSGLYACARTPTELAFELWVWVAPSMFKR